MEWLSYLLKVSACTGLFYLLYAAFLQRLTFFRFNRAYLLGTLLLSFAIPALTFEINRSAPVIPHAKVQSGYFEKDQAAVLSNAPLPVLKTPERFDDYDWQQKLFYLYWGIVLAMLLWFALQFLQLVRYFGKVSQLVGRLKLVYKSDGFTNCSFFNYVFVDDAHLTEQQIAVILKHESVHASRYHSLDKLLVNICRAVLWFNPIMYLYNKALEQAHEYEADHEVALNIGGTVYAKLLLAIAVKNSSSVLVHSFAENPVKKRIKMLFTNKSIRMKKLTYLSLIPAALALVWLFGVQIVYADSKANTGDDMTAGAEPAERSALNISGGLAKQEIPGVAKPILSANETIAERDPRLIDHGLLGDNPIVIIDGEKYPAEILTRISPTCVKTTAFSEDKVEIATNNGRVEYATKAEIETEKIRKKMKTNGKLYNRYAVVINGHRRHEVMAGMGSNFAIAAFPVDYRILLSLDGKVYTEKEAAQLPRGFAYNQTAVHYGYVKDDKALFEKYGDNYDLVLQFSNPDTASAETQPERIRGSARNISYDENDKLGYSARDSTLINKEKRYISLYGNAELYNRTCVINADKIGFDSKTRTVTARNASFTFKGKKMLAHAALVTIYIDNGKYELLSGIKDF